MQRRAASAHGSVLVADGDRQVVELVTLSLRPDGYRVLRAFDGATALALARAERPTLAILASPLPDIDPLVLRRALQREGYVPVIILSTSSVAEDRWRALDLGADDYVVKPFGAGELAARVRAILRRTIPDGREPRPRDER